MNYKNYFKDNECPYCHRKLIFNVDNTNCWCPKEKCNFNHYLEDFKIVAKIKENKKLYKI